MSHTLGEDDNAGDRADDGDGEVVAHLAEATMITIEERPPAMACAYP